MSLSSLLSAQNLLLILWPFSLCAPSTQALSLSLSLKNKIFLNARLIKFSVNFFLGGHKNGPLAAVFVSQDPQILELVFDTL